MLNPVMQKDGEGEWASMYKDETYRNKLIQNGIERASFFSWEKSSKVLHDVFMEAVS